MLKSLGIRRSQDFIRLNVSEGALALRAHMNAATASKIINSAAYLAKRNAIAREAALMQRAEDDSEGSSEEEELARRASMDI